MAFSVTAPNKYNRVYDLNSVYYNIFESTLYNQPNFRYIIRVYSASNTLLTTVKKTPNANGVAYYNPTSYISTYLTSNLDLTNTLIACSSSYYNPKFYFNYEYGDTPVEYSAVTLTATTYFYNGCQVIENYDTLYGNNYWVASGSSSNGHFLTPVQDFWLDPNESMWLYFNNATLSAFSVVYQFYYNSLSSTIITYTPNPAVLTQNIMYKFGAGPANIPTGSTPANWDYYTITLKQGASIYISGYTVYQKSKCSQYDWSQVYWLNEHGGWSNFLFNKRKYQDYKITRNVYNKYLNYGSGAATRSQAQFKTDIDDIITLNSDWLNDTENLLIKSLMMSPDVRILENSIFVPYVIVDTEFNFKNKYDDGLYSVQIKLTKSIKQIVQNG